MHSANDIRSSFIDFFKDKGHQFVPSSPVVPIGDDTLLFANAGMNQFKDVFLGTGSRPYSRAVNSQKCIRAGGKHNDLEDVGTDTYHHTFFEMLGNWSLGDYFKAEAIEWAWQLITKVWGIDESKLYATVFAGDKTDGLEYDKEAAELWTTLTSINPEHIIPLGKKDNFWEMGSTGPCGPCSEIVIDFGEHMCNMKAVPGHKCAVDGDCERYMEFWNLVFIQYNRSKDGTLSPLPAKHVDTGLGFERVTRIIQNKSSNYDTDIFIPIISAISEFAGKKYTAKLDDQTDIALRVIADHIRTLTFAITDGGVPSNEGRGYVLRRILRRASRFGRVLDMHEPFIYKLVDTVVDLMGDAFEELKQRSDFVKTVIESEETSFGKTLDRGLEIFKTAAAKAQKAKNKTINGEDAFQLYDTFGFPLDLTQLMAREQDLAVDTELFEKLMNQQRQRARAAQKDSTLASFVTDTALPITDDSLKYETDSCTTKILGWIDAKGFETTGELTEQATDVGLVLEKTCFYAESGGQAGDLGNIETPTGSFVVEATEKIADCVIHKGKMASGKIPIGEKATATVSKDRLSSRKNHTATHILQWALQQTLGDSIAQQGSLVCPEYLRFDFTCPKALTAEQIKKVEQLVNEKINQNLPLTSVVLPIDQAKKLGAMALFGEKYGDQVRVVAIDAPDADNINKAFSREFCGGTHTENTGEIGAFKITKEESISAGVRRTTALTGPALTEYLTKRSDCLDELCQILKARPEELSTRLNKLIDDNKNLSKQLKTASKQSGSDIMTQARELLENCEKIGNSSMVVSTVDNAPAETIRSAIDMIKKKAKSAAVVFAATNDGKVMLMAGVTDDLIKKGLKAGDIVKEIAPIVGGGGGGRPQFAQAGGKIPEKINDALTKAADLIKKTLG